MFHQANRWIAAALLASSLIACNTTPQPATIVDTKEINVNTKRAAASVAAVEKFSLDAAKVDLSKVENLQLNKVAASAAEDAEFINNLHRNLQAAESKAQALNVRFSMADEPIENGVFLFAIDAPEANALTMEIYDEEGFELAANSKVDVASGNNYKALNVRTLENGNYIMRLKDGEGKELVRSLTVRHQ